ncbi:MAG: MFS transporter [Ruthenibacterium lactatiformans]
MVGRLQRQPARYFLAGIQQPFALSATQLGLIVTVSYIGNLVFLLVGGNVIERFEKKKPLLALTGIWMAALAVFASQIITICCWRVCSAPWARLRC